MSAGRMVIVAAMLCSLVACKPDAGSTSASDDLTDRGDDPASETIAATAPNAGRAGATQPAQGGAFAKESGFQLPVPVSNAPVQSSNASLASRSKQIDVTGVTSAVVQGLQGTGSNVQVRVDPGGIVSLSGEVGSVAELQRAHYLARAQPGVVEVDYRSLRVRQQ